MTEFDIAKEIHDANERYITPEYLAQVERARRVFLEPLGISRSPPMFRSSAYWEMFYQQVKS